jgi:hypothetical protein
LPILDISPKRALKNAVKLLSDHDPELDKAIIVAAGFGTLAAGLYFYIYQNQDLRDLVRVVGSRFKASVTISADDHMNQHVLSYLKTCGLLDHARRPTLVDPDGWRRRGVYQALNYAPQKDQACGFWYQGHRLIVTRQLAVRERERQYARDDDGWGRAPTPAVSNDPLASHYITITCWSFGAGVAPILAFLSRLQLQVELDSQDNETTVYRVCTLARTQELSGTRSSQPSKLYWDDGTSRPARTLASVSMESTVKNALVDEIERYFHEAEERYYAQRGIPYRRGIMFHGPPGTGKNEFCHRLVQPL